MGNRGISVQYSIMKYSEVDVGNRIDAEYFQLPSLHMEEELLKHNVEPLRNFCSITGSAFYPAATHLYERGDLPFIRCVDCISYPAITTRQNHLFEKIPVDFANAHKNIQRLSSGEIVITKVGTPCYASIIQDIDDVALSRTVVGLKSINNINPYYLVTFLRSKYGFLQLLRERELTIQFQLTLERVGNVLIFKPTDKELESVVVNGFHLYEQTRKASELLFDEAQTIILSELGLTEWEPKHRSTFIKKYSDTQRARRIDAEYYQPKYEEIIKAIRSCAGGWDTLGNLVTVKKGVEVGSGEYLAEGIPFVRVSNVSPFEITEEKYISAKLYAELGPSYQPSEGEILFSKDATPGIAYYLNTQPQKMIPSGGILRLQNRTDKVNNEYLALVLNSILTKEQINRDVGGSIILHWRPDQVKETAIPLLPAKRQAQVQQTIIESFNLRNQSERLLECAKRAVEMAIEQGEKKAIEWLDKQTRAMPHPILPA